MFVNEDENGDLISIDAPGQRTPLLENPAKELSKSDEAYLDIVDSCWIDITVYKNGKILDSYGGFYETVFDSVGTALFGVRLDDAVAMAEDILGC